MADIVNGGAIILVAALGLAAIVGGAGELRELAGPASGPTEPDAVSADLGDGPSGGPGQVKPLPTKHLGDDRDDRRGDDEDDRGRDRDDDRHHDEGDDDDDENDEEDDD